MPELRCTKGAFFQVAKNTPEIVIPGVERLEYTLIRQVVRTDINPGDGLGQPVAGKGTICGALWCDSPDLAESLFDLTPAGAAGNTVLGVRYERSNRIYCKRFYNVLFGVDWGGGNRVGTVAGPDGGEVNLQRITWMITMSSAAFARDYIKTVKESG